MSVNNLHEFINNINVNDIDLLYTTNNINCNNRGVNNESITLEVCNNITPYGKDTRTIEGCCQKHKKALIYPNDYILLCDTKYTSVTLITPKYSDDIQHKYLIIRMLDTSKYPIKIKTHDYQLIHKLNVSKDRFKNICKLHYYQGQWTIL